MKLSTFLFAIKLKYYGYQISDFTTLPFFNANNRGFPNYTPLQILRHSHHFLNHFQFRFDTWDIKGSIIRINSPLFVFRKKFPKDKEKLNSIKNKILWHSSLRWNRDDVNINNLLSINLTIRRIRKERVEHSLEMEIDLNRWQRHTRDDTQRKVFVIGQFQSYFVFDSTRLPFPRRRPYLRFWTTFLFLEVIVP